MDEWYQKILTLFLDLNDLDLQNSGVTCPAFHQHLYKTNILKIGTISENVYVMFNANNFQPKMALTLKNLESLAQIVTMIHLKQTFWKSVHWS